MSNNIAAIKKIYIYQPFTVCANSSSGVSPKNGTHPTKNSYNIIPIDHQSTGLP